jgi:hypothetical protein
MGVVMVAAFPNRRRLAIVPAKAPFKPSPRPRE